MQNFWVNGEFAQAYRAQMSVSGLLKASVHKLDTLLDFFQWHRRIRLSLIIPLLLLPWVVRDWKLRFALLTSGVLTLGLLLEIAVFPHYAAPVVCLVAVFEIYGLRQLRGWRWRDWPLGQGITAALLLVAMGSFGLVFFGHLRERPSGFPYVRADIERQLR